MVDPPTGRVPGRVPREKFDELVRPHVISARRFAATLTRNRDQIDDLVQEALTRAFQKWHLYDPDKGSVVAWLLAIEADQARRRGFRWRQPEIDLRESDLLTDEPSVVGLDIRRAVSELPRRQREAVVLHYYIDLPLADVATLMGCASGTVKASLSAARASLRARIGENYERT